MNVQVVTDSTGRVLWISTAKPGRSSEVTTARHHKLTAHVRKAGSCALAGSGFADLDGNPGPPPDRCTATR
ncbi:transposase family protein [Streptomyces monashensis]|uniref:transposase family protein n=1 Tax=Streptomyces monashensis TaxID=1678012 RepID=UPI003F53FBBA